MSDVHVNLLFEANTTAAKKQIMELGTQLNQLGKTTNIGVNSGSLAQAAQSARELQVHLGNAVNVNTGKLDMTKLNMSLQQSNQNLHQLAGSLTQAGVQGQQAFVGLARAVAQAEAPAFRLGAVMSNLIKTMGSAMMWSAAYGAINSVTQAFSSAVDYAKDLNKALTDISIVTDLTSNQLDDFAKQASKAAKELKTTTTEYAKAALIFYQQGLDSREVKERTDATIKMAQVTGEAVTTVSDQLTAIWNNFDNGTKSLEYYVDVITALGAATASSTDEIAQGLEKFAAIAETVGLSYEYATAALATVTAETRQSADVVGTAFKTMFARMQDLELGNVLDDGVTLGQYSQALQVIGVEALDANNNLRDMDDILNDMGEKWDTLTAAQKTATAQSVAGIRQYTQLIALMDNWDEFKINLDVAINSEGALDEQQDKWAKSAEAAAKRVAESANQIYSNLLNDDTVIGFTNAFADLLGTINNVVDSMWGFGPMILIIAGLFSRQLIPAVMNFAHNAYQGFLTLTGQAENNTRALQDNFFAQINSMKASGQLSDAMARELNISQQLMQAKRDVEKASKGLTAAEKEQLQMRLSLYEAMNNETAALARRSAQSKQAANDAKTAVFGNNWQAVRKKSSAILDEQASQAKAARDQAQTAFEEKGGAQKLSELRELSGPGKGKKQKELRELEQLEQQANETAAAYERLSQQKKNAENYTTKMEDLSFGQVKTAQEDFFSNEQRADTLNAIQEAGIEASMGADGSIQTEATLNNLEKIIQKRTQLNNVVEKSKAAVTDLRNMEAQGETTFTDQQQQEYIDLANQVGMTTKQIEQLKQFMANGDTKGAANLFDQIRIKADATSGGLNNVQAEMRELLLAMASPEALDTFIQKMNLSEQEALELTERMNQLKAEKLRLDSAMQRNTAMIQAFGAFGSVASQAAMTCSAIMMLKDALDFSKEVGPLQRIMSILMGFSMLMPLFTGLTTGIGRVIKAKKEGTITNLKEGIATFFNTQANKENAESNREAAAAQELENKKKKEGAADNLAEGAKTRKSKGKKGKGKTPKSNGGTPPAKDVPKDPSAGGIGPALTVLAIAAVAIATIIVAVKAADKAWNKTKYAMQEAAEAAAELKGVAQEAADKQKELQDNIKNYSDGLSELSKLTQGTDEYRKKMEESNETALNLINTYDELAGKYEVVNGLIVFQDGALKGLERQQNLEKARLQNLSAQSTQNAKQAKINYDREQYARNHMSANNQAEWNNEDTNQTFTGAAWGAGLGGAGAIAGVIAGLSGPVGWAILGAAILAGGVIGAAVEGKESTSTEQAEIDKLYKAYSKQGSSVLEQGEMTKLLGKNSELVKSLGTNSEELKALMKSMKALEDAQRAQLEAYTAQQAESIDANWSRRSDQERNVITEIGTKLKESHSLRNADAYEATDYYTSFIWKFATDEGKKQFTDYMADVFKDRKDVKATNFGDTGVEYEYLDSNGSKQKAKVLYADIAAWEEQQGQDKAFTERYNKITEFASSLNQLGAVGTGLSQVITDGSLNMSEEDYKTFVEQYNKGELEDEMMAYGEALGNGYAGRNELNNLVLKAIREYDPKKALDAYTKQVEAEINSTLQKGASETEYSEKALESYADVIMHTTEALSDYNNEWERLDKKKVAAKTAVQLAKFTKGVRDLRKALNDNIDTLNNFKEGSIESWEAIAELQTALKDVFGVDVSGDFVAQHLDEIKKLADGTEEGVDAFDELSKAAARDYVANLDITVSGREALSNALEQVIDITEMNLSDIDIQTKLNNEDTIAGLNDLLAKGEITAEQVQGAFEAIGYTPDIRMTTVTQKSKMYIYEGTDTEATPVKTLVTETDVQVPYIAGENTANLDTLGDQTITGQTENGSGFSQMGGTREQRLNALGNIAADEEKENAKARKKAEDEIERYHQINSELDKLERQYDRLKKKRDRAWGPEKLKYMDQELKVLEDMAKVLGDEETVGSKIWEANQNLQKDKTALSAFGGVKYTEDGRIANYNEIMNEALAQLNADPTNETLKESYDNFKKAIEQYEETWNLVEDLKDEQEDNLNQQLDLKLEKIDAEVEYKIDMADFDLSNLTYQIENLSDAIGDAAEKFRLLGNSIEANVEKAEAAEKALKDTLKTAGLSFEDVMNASPEELETMLQGKTLTADQIQKLKDNVKIMQDATNEMEAQFDQYSDTIVASFEDMNKEFEKSLGDMEHMNSMIESYRNIVDLAGKDALGISDEMLTRMSKAQYNIANGNITIAQAQLEQNKAALASLQEQIAAAQAAGDTRTVKELQEAYDEVYATVQENEQSLMDATTAALEARTKMFEDQMNSIMNKFEDAMSGRYGSFEAMQTAFDQQSEIADRYVADYEKIYELSKLTRDITNSIDDTDSIKGKERLREIQEEINKLQESGVKMTKYEVEELRAKYDLRLAEIALEEAQNAKSTVRMVRNATGNWGYVYTADNEAIDSAFQKYEDTLYAYQNKMQEYTDELQARLVAIPQEYANAVRAIYEDQTLTDEERRIRIEETQAYYQDMYRHVVNQMGVVNEDARILYEQDWTRYAAATGYKISENQLWVDNFDETIAANISGFDSLQEVQDGFLSSSCDMLSDLTTAYSTYQSDVCTSLSLAGMDAKTFGQDVDEYMWMAEKAAYDAGEEAKRMGEKNVSAFTTAINGLAINMTEYANKITEWNGHTADIGKAVDSVIEKYRTMIELASTGVEPPGDLETDDDNSTVKLPDGTSATKSNITTYSSHKEGVNIDDKYYWRFGTKWYSQDDLIATGADVSDSGHLAIDSGVLSGLKAAFTDTSTIYYLDEEDGGHGLSFTEEDELAMSGDALKLISTHAPAAAGKSGYSDGVVVTPSEDKGDFIVEGDTGNIQRYKHTWWSIFNYNINNIKKDWEDGLSAGAYEWEPSDVYPDYGYLKYVGGGYVGGGANNTEDAGTANYGFKNAYVKADLFKKSDIQALIANGTIKSNLTSFDTGGYTGEWDSSGRLAWLHQKELVLNSSDTANFLAATNIIRDITKTIDLQAMAQSNYLSALSAASVGTAAQVIEQQVTIHAEFPNATERSEIEAAFDTLLNRASQFANRKN